MPRNRKIAEALFLAGIIERWGSGTTRIASELQAAGLPLPEFESEPGRLRVAFHKQIFTEERLMKMGLSERQIKAVIYAKTHGQITNSEYQDLMQVSKRTASRDLNDLIFKGIFISSGTKGRGSIYQIKGPSLGQYRQKEPQRSSSQRDYQTRRLRGLFVRWFPTGAG